MKSIMNYDKWEIVLVPFPFTNLSTSKRRPALIVSPVEYNKDMDVVIAFITSKVNLAYRFGDYHIQDWKKSQLPKPSLLRMKFATIDKSIIVKKLGRLSASDAKKFTALLVDFFSR